MKIRLYNHRDSYIYAYISYIHIHHNYIYIGKFGIRSSLTISSLRGYKFTIEKFIFWSSAIRPVLKIHIWLLLVH